MLSCQVDEPLAEKIGKTDDFLKTEIKNYHDVQQIMKTVVSKSETKTSKGLFGLFGRSSSPTKDKDGKKQKSRDDSNVKQKAHETHSAASGIPLNEKDQKSYIPDMKNTSCFLSREIENYNDVRPLVTSTETSHIKSEKEPQLVMKEVIVTQITAGIPDQKESVRHQAEYSALENAKTTDTFLKQEIENYHDVKQIVKSVIPKPETKTSKGLLGLFKKRSSSPIKKDEKKQKAKYGEKSDVVKQKGHEALPLTSDSLIDKEDQIDIHDVQNTKSFLKREVENFNDVRALTLSKKTTDVKGKAEPLVVMKEVIVTQVSADLTDQSERVGHQAKESVAEKLKGTNDFLKFEVENYHDVKQIVKPTAPKPEAKTSKGLLGLFGKRSSSPTKDEKKQKSKDVSHAVKQKTHEIQSSVSDVPVDQKKQKSFIQDLQNTNDFLSKELENYNDVKPLTTVSSSETTPTKCRTEPQVVMKEIIVSQTSTGTSDQSELRNERREESTAEKVKKTDDFLKLEIENYHDVKQIIKPEVAKPQSRTPKGILKIFGKKSGSPVKDQKKRASKHMNDTTTQEAHDTCFVESDSKGLQKSDIQNMNTTKMFLNKEVENYNDVKPVLVISTQEELSTKTAALPQEIRKDVIVRQVTSSLSNESKQISHREMEKAEKVKKTDDFLKSEIENYDDVKRSVEHVDQKPETKTSKGLFKFFGKKGSSPTKDRKKSKPKEMSDVKKQEVSKTKVIFNDGKDQKVSIQDWKDDTYNFLRKETENYDDVKPLTIMSNKYETPMKHRSEPQEIRKEIIVTQVTSSNQTQPVTSSDQTQPISRRTEKDTSENVRQTDAFLKTEVENHHDVKQKAVVIKSETGTSKGPFEIFGKGSSLAIHEDKMQAPRDVSDVTRQKAFEAQSAVSNIDTPVNDEDPNCNVQNVKYVNSFLRGEIENYDDVKPLVTEGKKEVTYVKSKTQPLLVMKEVIVEKITTSMPEQSELIIQQLEESTAEKIGKTDDFLNQEIENYHDVKQITKSDVSKAEGQISKGLFGIFGKKGGSPSKAQKGQISGKEAHDNCSVTNDGIKHKTYSPADMSVDRKDKVPNVQDMTNTSDFLSREIENYNDVRPLTTVNITEKSYVKNRTEPQKIMKEIIVTQTTTPDQGGLISHQAEESTTEKRRQTDNFLKLEIENYHDAKPITKSTVVREDETKTSKGLFGLFTKKNKSPVKDKKKKSSKEVHNVRMDETHEASPLVGVEMAVGKGRQKSDIQDLKDTSTIIKRESESYDDAGLLDPSEKTSEKSKSKSQEIRKEIIITHMPDQSEVISRNLAELVNDTAKETVNFLNLEIANYHDVKPVVCTSISSNKAQSEENASKAFFSAFTGKKKPDVSGIRGDSDTVSVDEVNKYKNVSSIDQNTGSSKGRITPVDVVHEVKNISDSQSFLKEVDYHDDVRSGEIGIEKLGTQIPHFSRSEQLMSLPVEYNQPKLTHDFLTQEIENYNDTKVISHAKQVKQEGKQQKSGLFSLFGKKSKESIDSKDTKEEKIRKQATMKVHTEKEPQSIEEISHTQNFLKHEVDNYHDVKKVGNDIVFDVKNQSPKEGKNLNILNVLTKKFKSYDVEEEAKKSKEPTPELQRASYKRLDSRSLDNQIEPREIEGIPKTSSPSEKHFPGDMQVSRESVVSETPKRKDKKRGNILTFFGNVGKSSEISSEDTEEKHDVEALGYSTIPEKISLSKETMKNVNDTHDFLKYEIANYQDVKPLITTDLDVDEDIPESISKSSGLFSIFSRKEKIDSPKSVKKKYKKPKKEKSLKESAATAECKPQDEKESKHSDQTAFHRADFDPEEEKSKEKMSSEKEIHHVYTTTSHEPQEFNTEMLGTLNTGLSDTEQPSKIEAAVADMVFTVRTSLVIDEASVPSPLSNEEEVLRVRDDKKIFKVIKEISVERPVTSEHFEMHHDQSKKIIKETQVELSSSKSKPKKTVAFGEPSKTSFYCTEFLTAEENRPDVKQITGDFIEDMKSDSEITQTHHFSKMTRTVSDGMSNLQKSNANIRISEANIDLSDLPTNYDRVTGDEMKAHYRSYVTSPSFVRRAVSQKLSSDKRPILIEIVSTGSNISSDEESYIVTEPDDQKVEHSRRYVDKPDIQLESDNIVLAGSEKMCDRSESKRLSGSETLTETRLDDILTNLEDTLVKDLNRGTIREPLIKDEKKLESVKVKQQSDFESIEQSLRNISEALENLETTETKSTDESNNTHLDRKLHKVAKKFDKMASEVMDETTSGAKQKQLSTPEMEEQNESAFQRLVSQLSVEEVSDFQKEYGHLWDENTFSPSDDWDSKTPDSQADVQDLPQGEVVYMGPVSLNKGHLVNKAGIEVDVIPIMRSPCVSPVPKKKNKRPQSELGFYKKEGLGREDDRGSLPDLQQIHSRGSLVNLVLQMNPDTFLSRNSHDESMRSFGSEKCLSLSFGSSESVPKGVLMNAVVNWLQKSTPFSSSDNLDQQGILTGMQVNQLLSEDEDFLDTPSNSRNEKSGSRYRKIPDIVVDQGENKHNRNKKNERKQKIKAEISKESRGEEAAATISQDASSSFKAGSESSEHPGSQAPSHRPVADQHQLSDEMKELLKELERESKQ